MTTVMVPPIGQPARAPSGRLRVQGTHWMVIVAAIAIFAGVVTVVGRVLHTKAPARGCILTTSCVTPPLAQPLGPSRPFVSQGGFTFDERSDCDADSIWRLDSQTADAVSWVYGNGYPIEVKGQSMSTGTVDDMADGFASGLPGVTTLTYNIPGAELGSYRGVGRVYDGSEVNSEGSTIHYRALVIAVARHGVGVEVTAIGPYRANSTDDYSHSNPASTDVVMCLRGIVNTVQWSGDPQP